MAKKLTSPLQIICVIVKRGDHEKVANILYEAGVEYQVNCLAEGTARSDVQNLFGFEILDRDMVLGIISTQKSKQAMQNLNKEFDIQIEEQICMAFTIPFSSATSDLLEMLNIKC